MPENHVLTKDRIVGHTTYTIHAQSFFTRYFTLTFMLYLIDRVTHIIGYPCNIKFCFWEKLLIRWFLITKAQQCWLIKACLEICANSQSYPSFPHWSFAYWFLCKKRTVCVACKHKKSPMTSLKFSKHLMINTFITKQIIKKNPCGRASTTTA